MKGLELSEKFYIEHGENMLRENFSELQKYIAVGLVGSGSECFGFDDCLSVDHDFEPGFCIFLPGEEIIDSKSAFALERAYSKLPKEFMGFKRSKLSPVGGNRHGVIRIGDFLKEKTGDAAGCLSLKEWFFVPEQSLAELVNGKLFYDGLGFFTEIRGRFAYLPEDVRLKKLAGNLLMMGQSGLYNYERCIARKETAAAQMAVFEFAKSAVNVIFLLNKTYMTYYKWVFKAMRNLAVLSELESSVEHIISSPNDEMEVKVKIKIIEELCKDIVAELKKQKITDYCGEEMEGHAYSVNNKIKNEEIRNLHILYGV